MATNSQQMESSLTRFIKQLGAMRIVLALLTVAVIVLAPKAGTRAIAEGWAIVPTLLVPVFAPLIFMLLMLDALMAGIFMAEKSGPERARYRNIMRFNLVLGVLLVLYWLPYFLALGKPTGNG